MFIENNYLSYDYRSSYMNAIAYQHIVFNCYSVFFVIIFVMGVKRKSS